MRRVAAQFEGLLVAQMLAPLERSFGEAGSIALTPFAQAIATADRHGFGAVLTAALERSNGR